MLDLQRTRERFADWLKTDDFKLRYCANAYPAGTFGPALTKWCFIIGLVGLVGSVAIERTFKSTDYPVLHERLLLVSLTGTSSIAVGIILGLLVTRDWVTRRLALRTMRKNITTYEPIVGSIVIMNTLTLVSKQKCGGGLVAITPDPWGDESDIDLKTFSTFAGSLYAAPAAAVPPQFKKLSAALKNDIHQDGRWRIVPKELTDNTQFLLCDVMMQAACFGPRAASGFVLCAVAPNHFGPVYHLPEDLMVWTKSESGAELRRYSPDDVAKKDQEITPTRYTDEIKQHIERFGGCSLMVIRDLEPRFVHVDILIIPPGEGREWHTLVTSGMSSKPMNVPPAGAHLTHGELALRLPKHWAVEVENHQHEKEPVEWVIRWLKALARFPHALQTSLVETQTFQNCTPPEPIATDVPFTGWLLVNSASGGTNLEPLKCADGQTIYFHSLIPIHTSEMEFKLAQGAEKLQEKLIAFGATDLLAINRKPVV